MLVLLLLPPLIIASMGNPADWTADWAKGVPTRLLAKTTLISVNDPPDHLPVHTLTFAIPHNAVFTGKAKPHSQIRIDLGDVVKMVVPHYKPKSYSVSELRADEFDVTFKVYPNGRASGCLNRLQVGDDIMSFGKSANRKRNAGKYVGIVAYGVGMTEGLPIARAELEKGDAETVVLLWASRTMADTFWMDKLEALQQQYPNKFQLKMILSREKKEGCLHGRIDSAVLQKVFDCPCDTKDARFLSVGTKEMMRMTDGWFADIGFPMPQHALLPKTKE